MSGTSDVTPAPPLFQPLRSAAFAWFATGDYDEALQSARRAEALFPQKGEVPFWLACAHCRLGEPEAALAALRAGRERGHYWPEGWLLEDDDLEPLRRRPDFVALVRESEATARRAYQRAVSARLEPVIVWPPADGGVGSGALVLAFHGWGQDADEFALHWRAAADRGFTVVVPRSRQELTPGFFVWDDRIAALADVNGQFRRVAGESAAEAPAPRLLLAGFSQGGGLAVDLAIEAEPAPSAGVLAVSAGVEDLVQPPAPHRLAAAAARRLRGRLVVGSQDEALQGAGELARALADAGLGGDLTVRPDVGHEMPEPPGEILADELAALLV